MSFFFFGKEKEPLRKWFAYLYILWFSRNINKYIYIYIYFYVYIYFYEHILLNANKIFELCMKKEGEY